ncbi:hypothetical protein QUF70_02125 [Desulfobacterales bacterium HSG17]|nr:hypothetical protein [Desulfobacterales bacterium HSG17]
MNAKKIIRTLIIMAVIFGFVSISYAGDRSDRRQKRQADRIYKGVRKGKITRREYNHLNRQQNRIDRAERRAGRDGYISRGERNRLERMQDRADRDIYRSKHNNRQARKHHYKNKRNKNKRNYRKNHVYRDRHERSNRRHKSNYVNSFLFPNIRLAITPLGIFPVID